MHATRRVPDAQGSAFVQKPLLLTFAQVPGMRGRAPGPGDLCHFPRFPASSSSYGRTAGRGQHISSQKRDMSEIIPSLQTHGRLQVTDIHEVTSPLLSHAYHRSSLNPPAGQKYYPHWKKSATWK